MSRTNPIKAADLAALIAVACDSESLSGIEAVLSLPRVTVIAVMKASSEFANEAWYDAEKADMKWSALSEKRDRLTPPPTTIPPAF